MFVAVFVLGGWAIWLVLVIALTIVFFALMVFIVAFLIGLLGFVVSHLFALCGMRSVGLTHPMSSLGENRLENTGNCAENLHLVFRTGTVFSGSLGVTSLAIFTTLGLKVVMMSLITYYTLANANFASISGGGGDDYKLNVLLEKAEMPKLFTWRWAWMFWPIVKELFKAATDFLILAFTSPFSDSSWTWLAPLMNPFTCFWSLFTNPGWAITTTSADTWFVSDAFVRAILASRLFTGVLTGLGHVLEQLGCREFYKGLEYSEEDTTSDEESSAN